MQQTLLALGSLMCVSMLALNSQRLVIHHTTDALRGDVEARLVEMGDRLLDVGGTLPVEGSGTAATGVVPADDLRLGFPPALGAWHDQTTTVSVPGAHGALEVRIHATVEAVAKQGTRFVPTTDATPLRRVRLDLSGPMRVTLTLERLYAPLS